MSVSSSVATDGRAVSRARRHALSAGKTALPPANERVREGSRTAPPAPIQTYEPATREPDRAPPVAVTPTATGHRSAREEARARRLAHSHHGRGSTPPMPPTRPPRIGRFVEAPVIIDAQAEGGPRVTSRRIAGNGNGHVTGVQRGTTLPISGTQYIGTDSAAAWSAGGPKVGLSRSEGGVIISGTLVRSKVQVTGDEAGGGVTITGAADALIDDDVTVRPGESASPVAQFARQTEPHGHSVHSNIARSVRFVGSRVRQHPITNQSANLATDGGPPVTGSAGVNGVRPNGEDVAVRRGPTGMTAFTARPARVNQITGIDVEQHPRVTGNESGSGLMVTGSSYSNMGAKNGRSAGAAVGHIEARTTSHAALAVVTGDTPLHDPLVTGTARGAVRDVTGTPYFTEASAATPPAASVETLNERFSVTSPQRSAQLRAQPAEGASRITGSFSGGHGKVTGNLEFAFPKRLASNDNPARLRITGEGRSAGRTISGEAWLEQSNVTGTEGTTAAARNPSRRAGKPQGFSGARRFKTLAHTEEPKHLVTGMFGYSSDSAAKVTLSGGAQG